MRFSRAAVAILALLPLFGRTAHCADEAGGPRGLTFFGWSDQHVQTNGDADHLLPAIDAMNDLPGTAYPDHIGGTVETPAFVFGCGDITEWPTTAARDRYAELIEKRLKFPAYDIAGNHDGGGKSPSETLHRWIIARHGALSYSFDRGAVHFVAVFSEYDESLNNPSQPVSQKALDFIRSDLGKVRRGTPVVVALHLCFDAITNRDELVNAFGDANLVVVLGGHYHTSKADRYRNVNFLQLPSPAPNGQREIMVIRIAGGRLLAMPYNYQTHRWNEAPGKMLDVAVQGLGSK